MKKLLFFSLVLSFIAFTSCSDSGGGSNEGPTGSDTQMYDVSVSKSPSDAGTISPSADSSYEEGTDVSLEAKAGDAYTFMNWAGDVESSDNPLSVTVDQDYSLTANFKKKSYSLTTNTDGKGEVTEEVVQQNKDYEHGTVVELTANPAEGWKFVEWKGDITGSENPTQITVDAAKEVTAVFEKKSYELTVNTEGEGAVSEEVVQAKEYEYGTVVELTANPADGWKFTEWKGALSGTENPKQITVDQAKEVTAIFEKKSYALTVNIDGSGSVVKTPDQTTYQYGTTVELEAKPGDGQRFVEWSGAISSTDNPTEVTINQEMTVTVTFDKKLFYLAENGVTVKCPEANVGDKGTVEGVTYTKRSADQITVDNAETTCTTDIDNMNRLFNGAESFNADLSSWDVSKVTDMTRMFRDAKTFDSDLSNWDVSNVIKMTRMFSDAASFNADISSWDVSKVTDMNMMFHGAASFNADISSWDVSLVSDMGYMFSGASSFASDLSSWDVSNVTNMNGMFQEATSFNSDIGSWDVSAVSGMQSMFQKAASFNQDLSGWCVQLIDSEPYWFDDGSPLENNSDYHPQWGTCPAQ